MSFTEKLRALIPLPGMQAVPPSRFGWGLGAIAALLGLGYTINESIYNVEGGHAAVLFNRFTGVNQTVVMDGTHFRIPLIEYPTIFDIRTRANQVSASTHSRDLQMVGVGLRVLTRPIAAELPVILQTIGPNYDEVVLPSIVHEVLKGVLAQYNAAQLISGREQISRVIKTRLMDRARDFCITLDDVSITHLNFSPQYSSAVEKKQIAQQDVERAKWAVEQAEQDAKSAVVRAEGEAKAAKLIGDAVANNPGYVDLKAIETAREIATALSQSKNTIYLDSNQLFTNMASAVSFSARSGSGDQSDVAPPS